MKINQKIDPVELKKLLKNPYINVSHIARHFKVSRQAVYKFIKARGISIK